MWRVRWQLDGITFNGDPDSDGTAYLITTESGWSGSPPVRATSTDRPDDHGSYPAPVWHGARVIELTGRADCTSWEARRRAEHRLAGLATNPNTLYDLVCTEETGDLTAAVQRSDQTLVAIEPGGYGLTFTLTLRAPDPRKYAATARTTSTGLPDDGTGLDFEAGGGAGLDFETTTPEGGPGLDFGTATTGRATATNPGTADTAPTLTLTGPLNAPIRITRPDTGAQLSYLDDLPTGQTLAVDVTARTVLLGTTSRRNRAVVPGWNALTIPAMSTVDFALAHNAPPNNTARLAIAWRPAWW